MSTRLARTAALLAGTAGVVAVSAPSTGLWRAYFPALDLPPAPREGIEMRPVEATSCGEYLTYLDAYRSSMQESGAWPAGTAAFTVAGATRLYIDSSVANTELTRGVDGQVCVRFGGWQSFEARPRAVVLPLALPRPSAACAGAIADFNEGLVRHEGQHVRDMEAVVAHSGPPDLSDLVSCGATEVEARAALAGEATTRLQDWGRAITTEVEVELHSRPEGAASALLDACRLAGCP